MNVKIIKKDFPIFENAVRAHVPLTFLDNAAASQTPRQVVQAVEEYYKEYKANVHSGIYEIGTRAVAAYESARKNVALFIGAEAEEIVFTSGTTASLNMICQMLGKTLQEGDGIVVSQMEHHSNFIPWQQIAKEKRLRFTAVPLEPDGSLSLDRLRDCISESTKVVAVTHVSHALGVTNNISEICKIAHEKGVLCVVDAAQSTPHMPIDVRELNCDFLVFSGQKMLGPTGTGVLYGKKELFEKFEPVWYGGGMIREVGLEESSWADVPYRFEPGTPNIGGVIGLGRAVEYLSKLGMQDVREHEKQLTRFAWERLHQEGVILFGPFDAETHGGIISFTIPGVHPHDAADVLAGCNVAVRAGHHCAMPLMRHLGIPGTVRASFYLYNTEEDVERLVEGIIKVKQVFSKKM